MGRVTPGYETEVRREDGSQVAIGEAGIMWIKGVRGISLFHEYLNNPEATAVHSPGLVKIDAPGRLVVRRETIEEQTGQRFGVTIHGISGGDRAAVRTSIADAHVILACAAAGGDAGVDGGGSAAMGRALCGPPARPARWSPPGPCTSA